MNHLPKKKYSFTVRVLIGTGSGTVFGVLLWAASGSMDPGIHSWLRLVAHGYVSLFACLVIPMIFLASIRLVLRTPTETQVSKLTKYKKWVNTLMMAISATITSVMGLVFRFGAMPGTESIVFDWNAGQNLFSQIVALIPSGIGFDLIARTAEEFAQSGIPIKIYHEITAVDTDAKTVTVKNLKTGEILQTAMTSW